MWVCCQLRRITLQDTERTVLQPALHMHADPARCAVPHNPTRCCLPIHSPRAPSPKGMRGTQQQQQAAMLQQQQQQTAALVTSSSSSSRSR